MEHVALQARRPPASAARAGAVPRPRAGDGLKRALDVVLSGLALACLSPVIAATALAVAASLGRPVLFRQVRTGRGGRPFEIVKFRSMTDARDAHGRLLRDEARLTRLGHLLRASSLDELPELWNVLRGDMSLVGPRPLYPRYLPRYSPEQARRHEVRPGVTGWAQVNGRNALGWERKLALDAWYVDHRSLALDLRILARTVLIVLRREGFAEDEEEFLGTPPRPERARAGADEVAAR